MLILVCGSRNWGDYNAIYTSLSGLPGEREPITIMHGACSRKDPATGREISADMLAEVAAHALGFHVQRFPADWHKHGKRAGILRNNVMLDQHPDLVLAFQRAGSRGTQYTVDEARRRGIPVELHTA